MDFFGVEGVGADSSDGLLGVLSGGMLGVDVGEELSSGTEEEVCFVRKDFFGGEGDLLGDFVVLLRLDCLFIEDFGGRPRLGLSGVIRDAFCFREGIVNLEEAMGAITDSFGRFQDRNSNI